MGYVEPHSVEVGKEIREGEGENLLYVAREEEEEEDDRQLLDAELRKEPAEEHVVIGNQHAVGYVEPHLEEEDDRQILVVEEFGGLEEQGAGVGDLGLEEMEEEQRLAREREEGEERRVELERQRLAREREEEEERRVELERQRLVRERQEEEERLARKEEERVKQQKLKEKEYYDKYNADVLARVERQKQLQKFKEYQEQQVREVLIQLEYKKQLEKACATSKTRAHIADNSFKRWDTTRIRKIRTTGRINNWNN